MFYNLLCFSQVSSRPSTRSRDIALITSSFILLNSLHISYQTLVKVSLQFHPHLPSDPTCAGATPAEPVLPISKSSIVTPVPFPSPPSKETRWAIRGGAGDTCPSRPIPGPVTGPTIPTPPNLPLASLPLTPQIGSSLQETPPCRPPSYPSTCKTTQVTPPIIQTNPLHHAPYQPSSPGPNGPSTCPNP